MLLANFRSEVKHSDWLKIVTGFGTANPSALFQLSIAILP